MESGAYLEAVVALARHSVHESEWAPVAVCRGMLTHIPFAIFYVLCTVSVYIKESSYDGTTTFVS